MKSATLDELCEINVGRTPARAEPSYWGPGHRWLSIADMSQGLSITATKEQITDAGAKAGKVVKPGTVLLSFKLSIGKVGIAKTPLYTNEAIAALPVKDEKVLDTRYLMRALEAMNLADGSNRAAMGATLNKKSLAQIRVPLLPLAEQRRIAAILDHADALRAKRRQVLTHLAALPGSVFRTAFADVADVARLGDVATTTSGGTPNRSVPANYGGGIPWVKSGELHAGLVTETEETISTQGLSSSSAKLLPTGTVLLAMYGATAGVVGRLGMDAATNQAICAITPGPSLDPEYLIAALRAQTDQLVAKASGGAQPNLSQGIIRDILIPLPSLEEQQQFSRQVDAIAAQRSNLVGSQTMNHELFASLQARAFRGEL